MSPETVKDRASHQILAWIPVCKLVCVQALQRCLVVVVVLTAINAM